jgi:hypothetical protein
LSQTRAIGPSRSIVRVSYVITTSVESSRRSDRSFGDALLLILP